MIMEFESIIIKGKIVGEGNSARVHLSFLSPSDASEGAYYPAESVITVTRSPDNIRGLVDALTELANDLDKEKISDLPF